MDASEGQLKTVREVAARFKVNTKQVTQWIRDGKLRAMDVSRTGARVPRYRFSEQAIQELIANLEGNQK